MLIDNKERIKLRALAEAIVIQIHYQGIVPTYGAYHEKYNEVQEEVDRDVDNIMDSFNVIYQEKMEEEEKRIDSDRTY